MRNAYEILITDGTGKTVLDVGAAASSPINAIQNVLKRHKDKLEGKNSLTITIYPQADSKD